MATQAVFNTAELLEAILLLLPTRSLLTCQRVSRTFKATTDDSPALQRALFLIPGTAEDVDHDQYTYKWPLSLNSAPLRPKTTVVQGDYYVSTVYPYHLDSEEATANIPALMLPESARKTGVAINPLLVQWGPADRCLHEEQPRIDHSTSKEARFHPWLINVSRDASCRRMYISQPPLRFKNVYATTKWPVDPNCYFWTTDFSQKGGRLFGEVLLQALEGGQRNRLEARPGDYQAADSWQWWEFMLAREPDFEGEMDARSLKQLLAHDAPSQVLPSRESESQMDAQSLRELLMHEPPSEALPSREIEGQMDAVSLRELLAQDSPSLVLPSARKESSSGSGREPEASQMDGRSLEVDKKVDWLKRVANAPVNLCSIQ